MQYTNLYILADYTASKPAIISYEINYKLVMGCLKILIRISQNNKVKLIKVLSIMATKTPKNKKAGYPIP